MRVSGRFFFPALRSPVLWALLAMPALLGLGILSLSVHSRPAVALQTTRPAVVLELFTSQSCSSCPAAEKVLSALAEREDVVALEWHVDYWDDLVYGRAGRWQDPYSDPAFTERQRWYNQQLRGTRAVYTPQLIVAGRSESPGFRPKPVERQIEQMKSRTKGMAIDMAWYGANRLDIALSGKVSEQAEVTVVTFLPAQQTRVRGGENKGRVLDNINVVRASLPVGLWSGGEKRLSAQVEPWQGGEACAVLVQEHNAAPVYFGAYCPPRP